jgi:membrane-associated phospholipid phosphatase
MNFLKKFQIEEKAVCIYLSLGVLFFLFFDYSISKFFYNINSQTKSLFETLTHFGDSLYFFVPTIIIWAFIKIIQNKNKILLTISDISIFIFFNVLFSGIIVQIFKHLLGRPRPPMFHLFNLSSPDFFQFDSKWHSFPSGHTATIFAFIFCLIFLFPKIKNILISIAMIIASTRVIVGAHYVSDIFGGALVAYVTTILLRDKFFQKSKLFQSEHGNLISNENVNFIYKTLEEKFQSLFSLYLGFNFYLKMLTIMLLLSIVFFLFPNIDITISGLFFGQDGSFLASEQDWFIYFIRKMILPLLVLLVFFIPIAAAFKQYIYDERILDRPLRDWVFLLSCLIFGTGVIVNSIFKSFWGRARPNDTLVFGGEQPFTIPWLNVDYCESNCSFVSGDVSFFTLALAVLLIFNKQTWNFFAYGGIALISLLRIMEGDHFLSDTIMSYIITYVVIRILYDLFQLLPEDLNLKRKNTLKKT